MSCPLKLTELLQCAYAYQHTFCWFYSSFLVTCDTRSRQLVRFKAHFQSFSSRYRIPDQIVRIFWSMSLSVRRYRFAVCASLPLTFIRDEMRCLIRRISPRRLPASKRLRRIAATWSCKRRLLLVKSTMWGPPTKPLLHPFRSSASVRHTASAGARLWVLAVFHGTAFIHHRHQRQLQPYAQYTPPTRLNSTVASRRRCVLGISSATLWTRRVGDADRIVRARPITDENQQRDAELSRPWADQSGSWRDRRVKPQFHDADVPVTSATNPWRPL